MVDFGTAIQNFFFRTGNIFGRATRAEFWFAVPLVWAIIIGLFILDFLWVWDNLANRIAPSLNPLTYSWFIIFVGTFPSRFSVTVRRLHDSGRSGKWAFLPFGILYSGLILAFGVGVTAVMQGSESAQSLALVGVVGASMGVSMFDHLEPVWEVLFVIAANYEGTDVLFALLDATLSGLAYASQIEVTDTVRQGWENSSGDRTFFLLIVGYILAPFFSAAMYLFFMIAPSEQDNVYGDNTPTTNILKGVGGRNPLEAYSALIEMERAKSPEEIAAKEAARKDEVRKLYEQRVLGRAT